MRVCTKCGIEKELTEFYRNKTNYRTKLGIKTTNHFRHSCKDCFKKAHRLFRKQNPQHCNDEERKRNYGITRDRFEKILKEQGYVCAICKTSDPGRYGTWCVDHDHTCCTRRKKSCGKCVRGLLCNVCNRAVGMFKDSPAILQNALDYLNRYSK